MQFSLKSLFVGTAAAAVLLACLRVDGDGYVWPVVAVLLGCVAGSACSLELSDRMPETIAGHIIRWLLIVLAIAFILGPPILVSILMPTVVST